MTYVENHFENMVLIITKVLTFPFDLYNNIYQVAVFVFLCSCKTFIIELQKEKKKSKKMKFLYHQCIT